jgi:hypothetical protein
MFYKSHYLFCQKALLVLFFFSALVGCKNNSTKKEENEVADTTEHADTLKATRKHKVFHSIPSPLQISALLKQAGAKYVSSILVPPSNSGKYATNFSKSLIVGIYGTDLAYSNMFGQTQKGISYMEAIMKVSDGLGLAGMLSSTNMLTRFQKNMNNQDSLFSIISELFRETDESLKANKQGSNASLILAGGWIEGLYIATRLAAANPNQHLNDRIAELKFSLSALLSSMEDLKQNAENAKLLKGLEEIKQLYEKVTITYSAKDPSTNEDNKVTTINSSSKPLLSEDQLKELTEQIGVLRNSIVTTN